MNHREAAKRTWTTNGDGATTEEIKVGALLRIADSTEKLCMSRVALETDRDMYKRWWKEEQQRTALLKRRLAGLKGYVARLKREIDK